MSIHQGRAPLYADVTDPLYTYSSSQWSSVTMGPIILSMVAGGVSGPTLDPPMWRVPAAFVLVYLALFLLFLWGMRDDLRPRVCTLPPEPAGAA
ncbi:MAG: hypothetical protein VB934_09350, partial [Polyangiaceae bacterium]